MILNKNSYKSLEKSEIYKYKQTFNGKDLESIYNEITDTNNISGLRYFKVTGFAWSTTGSPNVQISVSDFYFAESDSAILLQGVFNNIP